MRSLFWIGDSLTRLKDFPEAVRVEMGFALYTAQAGGNADNTKPLKGLDSGVFEIVSSFDGDAYRAVYTVKLKKGIYVLHAFQKKSKHGIATPRPDMELIRQRLAKARQMDQEDSQ